MRLQLRSCVASQLEKERPNVNKNVGSAHLYCCTAVLLSISAFAVDGVVLINQNTVIAAGEFPCHITQPGSYRLTGNLVVTSANIAADGKAAIVIDADNVTLDLNGFAISGPNTCAWIPVFCTNNGVNAHGVLSFHTRIAVFNGYIFKACSMV